MWVDSDLPDKSSFAGIIRSFIARLVCADSALWMVFDEISNCMRKIQVNIKTKNEDRASLNMMSITNCHLKLKATCTEPFAYKALDRFKCN